MLYQNGGFLDRDYEPIPTTYGTFDCSSIGMDDIEFNFVEGKGLS